MKMAKAATERFLDSFPLIKVQIAALFAQHFKKRATGVSALI